MRKGFEPDGEEIFSQFMPWESIGQMIDNELRALWMYLQSLTSMENVVEEAE